jgi:hypothetical protein
MHIYGAPLIAYHEHVAASTNQLSDDIALRVGHI